MGIVSILKKGESFVKRKMLYRIHFNTINEMREGRTFTKLSKEQKEEVQKFWNKYFGKKISLKWHEYYLKVNGIFSPQYIPTYIYYAEIYPKLNDPRIAVVYSDKNMIDKLLGDRVKLPKTYIKNYNGNYYIDNKVVSKKEAIESCLNIDDAVIKHSLDTCQGKSILRFKSVNGIVTGKDCPKTIEELFDSYTTDFIVQAAIRQNATMAKLNPTSLNTVRIMTYWGKDGIVPVFAVVRMGRSGAVIDNASSGGMYCGVNMDGTLKEEAYTLYPFSSHTESDNGIVFREFKIPYFEALKDKARELHAQLPYAKIIGWDLSLNEQDEIELVEINANSPGLFQGATGPAFGEYTSEILEYCRNK
ncbi:MAG: hypothetical protein E7137_06410 [Rikenellaceae bacterium]|nr:hypothetical protein [Rikenellaceae bacterium]